MTRRQHQIIAVLAALALVVVVVALVGLALEVTVDAIGEECRS